MSLKYIVIFTGLVSVLACETPSLSQVEPLMRAERDEGQDVPLFDQGMNTNAGMDEQVAGQQDIPLAGTEIIAGTDTQAGTVAGAEVSGGQEMGGNMMGGMDYMVCGEITEQAIQAARPVDIVWVIDSSPSMGDEIEQIQVNLNQFAQRISMAGLDLRVALVGSEATIATPDRDYLGICVPPPLSAEAVCPDIDSEQYKHIRLNVHSSDPLSKMVEAAPQLMGFFRGSALKHIVFVTDDNAGWSMDADEFLQAITGNPLLEGAMIHSVVDLVGYEPNCIFDDNCSCGDERGDEYISLSEATLGGVYSVCEEDWTPLFTRLEERVVEGTELPCAYAFPEDTRSVMFSPDEVNVYWTPEGEMERLVPRVDNAEACMDQEGWYYAQDQDANWITLCPSSCGETQGTARFEFGCMVVKR